MDVPNMIQNLNREWFEQVARVKKLEEEIRALKSRTGARSDFSAFVDGFMAAREYYGTTDDETDRAHGAECARVQGPYICTCNEGQQLTEARESATHYML